MVNRFGLADHVMCAVESLQRDGGLAVPPHGEAVPRLRLRDHLAARRCRRLRRDVHCEQRDRTRERGTSHGPGIVRFWLSCKGTSAHRRARQGAYVRRARGSGRPSADTPRGDPGNEALSGVSHPGVRRRPAASNRPKSALLEVASAAPARIATAAIMQSARVPRRRPVRLKSRAVVVASSPRKGSGSRTTRAASWSKAPSTGPQRNSAQPTALMPTASSSCSQPRSWRSSADPATRARMRKPVSRWIIARARDGLPPPAALAEHRWPRLVRVQGSGRALAEAPLAPRERRIARTPPPAPLHGSRGEAPRTSTPSTGAPFAPACAPCRRRAHRSP